MGVSRGSLMGKAGPLVLARFVASAVTFAIPIVLARRLSLDEYGTYKQLLLLSMPLLSVLPFGTTQSLYYFVPRSERRRPYLTQTALYLLLAGVLGGLGTFASLSLAARLFHNTSLTAFRGELSLYVFLYMGSNALTASLTSQGKTSASGWVYFGSELLKAASLIVPVLLGWGLRGAMFGLCVWTVVRLVAAWAVVAAAPGPWWERGRLSEQLAYALPFGGAMLLNLPQQLAHQYVVSAHVSPAAFAVYSVGCFQLPLIDLLYQPTSEVLMVEIGEVEKRGRLGQAVHLFREASSKLAFFFLPLASFLFVAAPEFVQALFGAKFLGAVPIFRVSVLAVAFACLPMDGVLRARNETRFLFWTYLAKAIATVPLVWLGVDRFGMMGGIGAWAAAELLGKVMLFHRTRTALSTDGRRLGPGQVLPLLSMGKALLSAALAAVSVLGARWLIPERRAYLAHGLVLRAIPLMLVGAVFSAAYVSALSFAGVRPLRVLADLRR